MRPPIWILGIMFVGLALSALGIVFATRGRDSFSGEAGRAWTEAADGSRQESTAAGTPLKLGNEAWLTSFELTERSGSSVSSNSLRGKPYVVSFFFSTCPTICVQQNEKVKLLFEKFKEQPIRFVSISVDPGVDTPAKLAEYAQKMGASEDQWLFMTGDMNYIERIGAEVFQLYVTRRGHPEKFILVDAEGKIYGYYSWPDAAQFLELQDDIEAMLKDPAIKASETPKNSKKPTPAEPHDE